MSSIRMRRSAAVLATIAVIATVSACSTSAPAAKSGTSKKTPDYGLVTPGTITAATTAGGAPFATIDTNGKPTGMLITLDDIIAKRMGLKIVYKATDVDGALAGLSSGTYDMGAIGLVASPDREKTVDFTKPIFQGVNVVMVQANSPVSTEGDLAGKRVGASTGSQQYDYVNTKLKSAKLVSEPTNAAGISQLSNGNLDALVLGSTQASVTMAQSPGKFKLPIESPQQYPGAQAVSKNHAAFLKEFNIQLARTVKEGTLLKLYNKYFDEKLLPYPAAMYKYWPEIKQQVAAQAK